MQDSQNDKTVDSNINDVLQLLTELEKKYAQIIVMQKPKSKADALQKAGSKADRKYLAKMAWEIEQRPHVQAYMDHLRNMIIEEAGLTIQEIIHNARTAIQMAFENGKPKDADPHNRLLAELGGFVKSGNSPVTAQTNIKLEAVKGDSVDADFKKLLTIAGINHTGDIIDQ